MRVAALVAAVLGASALVAVGSTDLRDPAATTAFVEVDPSRVRDVVLGLTVLVLAYAFYTGLVGRHRRRSRRSGSRSHPLHVLLAILVVAVVVIAVRPLLEERGEEDATEPTRAPATAEAGDDVFQGRSLLTDPGWELWLVAGLGIVALGVLAATRTRDRSVAASPSRGPDGPVPTPSSRHPTDPRGRVFAAYRQVEEAADRSGIDRPPSRTVRRHLGTVGDAAGPEPAGRLADAYDRARYSHLDLDDAAADAAEHDSRRVREELE